MGTLAEIRLLFIVCGQRKTNFRFPFAENKESVPFPFHFAADKRKLSFSV
jgi:hypothetical protein